MPGGTSGVVSFGVKGGRDAACRFMNALKLAAIATHVADLRTCVLHPASTTHRQMNDRQLEEAGVSPDLIRFQWASSTRTISLPISGRRSAHFELAYFALWQQTAKAVFLQNLLYES